MSHLHMQRIVAPLAAIVSAALAGCTPSPEQLAAEHGATVSKYCTDCHSVAEQEAGLVLENPDLLNVAAQRDKWEAVVHKLAEARWPWRIHATYDESIGRFLDIFERVHRDNPIDKLCWFIDHAETVSERNLERIQALGGGIATQHRMAYQGEYYIRRHGLESAKRKPPLRRMLQMGLPVETTTVSPTSQSEKS